MKLVILIAFFMFLSETLSAGRISNIRSGIVDKGSSQKGENIKKIVIGVSTILLVTGVVTIVWKKKKKK